LSKDPQKWLIGQVASEIKSFQKDATDRTWPDNWIIATNIDPSGKPETGSFDAIRAMLKKSRGGKKVNVHIWGGRKILDLLALHGDVAKYYGHFLTPGHLITTLYEDLADRRASIEEIVRYFVATQFSDNLFTKLDQAGSSSDVRPGVHDLFIDLPFSVGTDAEGSGILAELSSAAAQCQKYSLRKQYPESWRAWSKRSRRARVVLIKGGPGQGKSTVGQYLCQINRAHLILSADGPAVIDSLRNAAGAVCEVAKRADCWPTSPRIPIQIELKEFAHWYSQRQESQARTVLVYMADTVERKIGCDTASKTIKRALASRSWLIVFDGLDEVPNDSKDAIASEILSFLNDVLIEIDGDVFAICTSRPQGYSGQFAGLEGPVIELTQLDATTAMRCARPVLTYGRTSEEAAKSIQTLETAILSPNVKELMTTPLQSHIMAVVVRDGGRPPERRWQLFNSFYLVMKKRESLKNFQDARIAKLLREEDRLLKSVHMRLGFVLHARAERSEGAQTTLSKEEFKHLVRDVVSQLVDQDIDNTVGGVMEATTERLVLVSTPESGGHVRFDIRQLQEFFAAEFLYAGVDTSELAQRIETIGGDAHWREVMHFLMSALVENQRTTDLSVAVQVLRGLNEGDGANGLYYRRMARAGLLAGRLLLEGVLEQDQRDRQQIKPLLDPLSGILDIAMIKNLARLGPMRSRQWLTQLLVDKVSTALPRESVGAVLILGWILPDDSADSRPAAIAFNNLPKGFQESVLNLWCPSDESEYFRGPAKRGTQEPLSQWVMEAAVNILNSPNWNKYRTSAIHSLLRICRSDGARFLRACHAMGIAEELAEAAFKCIFMLDADRVIGARGGAETIDCGFLKATPFPENWTNGKVPESLKDTRAQQYASVANGIFRLMLTFVWWAQAKSDAALRALVLEAELAGPHGVEAVPRALLALVPIVSAYAVNPYTIDHLRNVKASQLSNDFALESVASHFADISVSLRTETKSEHWTRLTVTLPQIAINIALSAEDTRWGGETKFVPELVSLLEREPALAGRSILGWGYLQRLKPELFEIVKRRVAELAPSKWQFVYHSPLRQVDAFKLELPRDLSLLSVLSPALVDSITGAHQQTYLRHFSEAQALSVNTILKSYGLDSQLLRGIATSDEHSRSVRAGALALYWLSLAEPKTGGVASLPRDLDLAAEKKFYIALVDDISEGWLTRALVNGILVYCSETEPGALALVVHLLEQCLDGDGPREELVELLESWREKSTAPVHAKQVMEKWLGYNFQTPSYART
jgi:hypothetical protein